MEAMIFSSGIVFYPDEERTIALEGVEHQQFLLSLVEEGDIHFPMMSLQKCQKCKIRDKLAQLQKTQIFEVVVTTFRIHIQSIPNDK